jgi:hypothetical protein
VGLEVSTQQVGSNGKGVVAVSSHLVFSCSDGLNTVLAHKTSNTTMADLKSQLLQFFGHAGTTITAQTEFVLLSNMGQKNHVIHCLAGDACIAEKGADAGSWDDDARHDSHAT